MENKYYDMYRNDFIRCIFCGKCIMLYYAKQHLRSKRCRENQELDENKIQNYLRHIKEINKLKSDLKIQYEESHLMPHHLAAQIEK